MTIIGGYLWWWSIQITYVDDFDDVLLFMVALMVGSAFLTYGLGVIGWDIITSALGFKEQIAKQKEWQVTQLPLECSECGKEISIRSVEWIGEDEARCPFCSKELEFRISR